MGSASLVLPDPPMLASLDPLLSYDICLVDNRHKFLYYKCMWFLSREEGPLPSCEGTFD